MQLSMGAETDLKFIEILNTILQLGVNEIFENIVIKDNDNEKLRNRFQKKKY